MEFGILPDPPMTLPRLALTALPFFALVELSRFVPAGVYARPFDLDLEYQTRVIQPAATPSPLRTAALAGTSLDDRPAQQR